MNWQFCPQELGRYKRFLWQKWVSLNIDVVLTGQEVVRSGISDNPVIIGTFEEMPVMQVDAFVVPEELADLIPKGVPADKVILVPRTISPWSAAEIISAALKVGNEHWQGKPSDYLS